MWTQQWLIKLLVAHVSFVGDPVSVVQNNEHLFLYLVVMVSTSFGRVFWQHKRQ